MAKSKDILNEPKSGEIKRLKNHIKHLDNEIKRLKSELKTYDKVFNSQVTFIKEKSRGLSLEDMLKGAKKKQTLEEIGEEKDQTYQQHEDRWKCRVCSQGVMRMIIVPNGTGSQYFRKCSIANCLNRTETKIYTEEVEE